MVDEALPEWLEHYLQVPAWVLYKSVADNRILWVNERLAEDLKKDRAWFVGRAVSEVWTNSRPETPSHDQRAVEENQPIDVVGEGCDMHGDWRWLAARLTPVGKQHVLIVGQDITARIKLAGLRLVLGRGIAGESRGQFGESFARQLLEGATLDEICAAEKLQPVEVLGKLGRLVGEQAQASGGIHIPVPVEDAAPAGDDLPAWLSFHWDLPGPVILLSYPALQVRWVNRFVLERNSVKLDDVIGIDAHQVWEGANDWLPIIERTMRERRSMDTVRSGRNLRGRQQWMAIHTTPVDRDRLLLLGDDVTADIQLQALRLLLGLNPPATEGPAKIGEAFARLLLDGASVANICAALEMSQEEVLSQASLIMGGAH